MDSEYIFGIAYNHWIGVGNAESYNVDDLKTRCSTGLCQ